MDPFSWVWYPGHRTWVVDGRIVVRPLHCENRHPQCWTFLFCVLRGLWISFHVPRSLPRKHHRSIGPRIHSHPRPLYMDLHCFGNPSVCLLPTFLSHSTSRHQPLLGPWQLWWIPVHFLSSTTLPNLWLRTFHHLHHVDPGLPFQTFPFKGDAEGNEPGSDPDRTQTDRSTDVMACEGARMRHGQADETKAMERS